MIMLVMKTALFLISLLGLALCIMKIFRTKFVFAPIITISAISLYVYIAGLLNVLLAASTALYLFGLGYIIYYVLRFRPKKIPIQGFICVIFVGILLLLLHNAQLMHYDNFSHWANLVKEMLQLNSFPTQLNDNITIFITYPPGSACFLYYVCRFIGTSDSIMIFAQALITFFSIVPLMILIKKKQIQAYIIFFVVLIITFTINIQIYDLLVDTLLPTIGLSLTVIIYEYRRDYKKALPIIVLLMSFLCLIKNSGIFFVIGNIALYVYYYFKYNKVNVKQLCIIIFMLAVPFILTYLWKRHTTLCFPIERLNSAKHTLSITSYIKNINLLDMTAISDISSKFFAEIINFKNVYILAFYAIDLISIIYCFCCGRRFGKAIIALNAFYIVYIISLWAMYLFSMPYSEAIDLASFDRYYATFMLYFVLVVCMFFLLQEVNWKQNMFLGSILVITIVYSCDLTTLWNPSYQKVKYQTSGRIALDALLKPYEGGVSKDKKVLVMLPNSSYSDDYNYFVIRYKLHTENFSIVHSEDDLAKFSNEDYMLISE